MSFNDTGLRPKYLQIGGLTVRFVNNGVVASGHGQCLAQFSLSEKNCFQKCFFKNIEFSNEIFYFLKKIYIQKRQTIYLMLYKR